MGYQVKVRDGHGTVHDECWTNSPQTAEQVVWSLLWDPYVKAAWIEED